MSIFAGDSAKEHETDNNNISFIIMSSSKKSMDMCEGDSEKCEGKWEGRL